MSDDDELAGDLVGFALRYADLDDPGHFLKAVMVHAAAALALMEGDEVAVETVYRLADAMVEPPFESTRRH